MKEKENKTISMNKIIKEKKLYPKGHDLMLAITFWIYGLIFFLYFIICYPLSQISKNLENKWNN